MFEEEIVIPKCFYPEFMFLSIRKRNTSWIPAFAGMTEECEELQKGIPKRAQNDKK
jgi:hypothetical protein